MASPEATAARAPTRGALAIAGASLLLALVSLLASFRVPFPAWELGPAASGGRMATAAAVGAALAAASALRTASPAQWLWEARLFAGSVGAALGIALALKLAGGTVAPVVAGVVGALLAAGLVSLVDGRRRISNLGLTLVLGALFIAATPAYMTSATEGDGLGGLAIRILGDVSWANGTAGACAAALVGLAIGAVLWRLRSGAAPPPGSAALLFGLAIGLGGLVAFVGTAGAAVARRSVASPVARIALAAAVGAALVMAADAAGRIWLGGYAPPLNVSMGFVALPACFWWNRARLRKTQVHAAGTVFEAAEAVILAGVTLGLLALACVLAGVVRSTT